MADMGGRLILTTDHGTMRVDHPVEVRGDRETNSNLRYKVGKNLGYNADEVMEIRNPEALGCPNPMCRAATFFERERLFGVPQQCGQIHQNLQGHLPARRGEHGGDDCYGSFSTPNEVEMSTLTEVHRGKMQNPGHGHRWHRSWGSGCPQQGVAVHGAMGAGKTTMVRACWRVECPRRRGESHVGLVHHQQWQGSKARETSATWICTGCKTRRKPSVPESRKCCLTTP